MRRSLLPCILALLPIAIVGGGGAGLLSTGAPPPTTLLIVRHAERADATANSNLSAAGVERARALVEVAREAGVTAVYSTRLCRTAQTAQPLAEALGLPLTVPATGAGLKGCAPAITVATDALPGVAAPGTLVEHVLAAHPGETVVLVGHSDTVPQLLEALGRGAFAPVSITGEFDNLFVVTARPDRAASRLVKARYGPEPVSPR